MTTWASAWCVNRRPDRAASYSGGTPPASTAPVLLGAGVGAGAARLRLAVATVARLALASRPLATAPLGRLGVHLQRLAGLEARHRVHRDLGLEHALDVPQQTALLRCHQGQGLALGTIAAGAADAVHVVRSEERGVGDGGRARE